LTTARSNAWEPLLAVADLAGGEWPERARRSVALSASSEDDDADGVRLLADIQLSSRCSRRSER
jgi:hypothetical protein